MLVHPPSSLLEPREREGSIREPGKREGSIGEPGEEGVSFVFMSVLFVWSLGLLSCHNTGCGVVDFIGYDAL